MFELVRSPDFANLPLIVEDFVKDNGGSYTGEFAGHLCSILMCIKHFHKLLFLILTDPMLYVAASQEDALHVVLDRHLVTGQNVQSTTAAVNNLILLFNSR